MDPCPKLLGTNAKEVTTIHRQDKKRAYLEANRSRYRQAKYAGTSKIFDEFCVVSGYPRKYAIHLLGTSTQESRWRPLPPAGGE